MIKTLIFLAAVFIAQQIGASTAMGCNVTSGRLTDKMTAPQAQNVQGNQQKTTNKTE